MRRSSRYASPGFELNGVSKDFKGEYGPKVLNDFALDFVMRHKDRPFFLYYPMLLTHSPFQPTPDSAEWDPALGEREKNNSAERKNACSGFRGLCRGRLGRPVDGSQPCIVKEDVAHRRYKSE